MIVAGAAQRFDGQHRIGIVRAAFALACILGDHPPFRPEHISRLEGPTARRRPPFADTVFDPLIMLNSVIS